MYVQYHVPEPRRGTAPLLLWHGGGLTGATWESTPDGREGWSQFFLRRGWATYVSDAVERGRSGWAMSPQIFAGEPVFLPKDNPWERFRIGAGPGSHATRTALPGTQFPVEAYDDFLRQVVPRWATTDAATLAAYRALLERVRPAVVVAHSQGGFFALRGAQALPERVRALVLVEPAGFGETRPKRWRRCAASPCWRSTAISSRGTRAGRPSAPAAWSSTPSCARRAGGWTWCPCPSAASAATATW